jgi:hypothetical protein
MNALILVFRYQSSLFPHWDIISGKCHAREVVLQRDGTVGIHICILFSTSNFNQNVKTDASCKVISGSWYSIYDSESIHLQTYIHCMLIGR